MNSTLLLVNLEQILVNFTLLLAIGANTREFHAFTREFGANTREFHAFTREFGANTREFHAFTREFRANTREFHALLVNLEQILVNSTLLLAIGANTREFHAFTRDWSKYS
ncbi:hypothetical protein UP17_03405 [Peribacillus simplex]|uniref:hypothetical protein n=1 Tax=Peribacillus simplex TaxID=1478 RepID=UPI000777E2CF|nr:hypothetical protein [Peribacillus simplex]AMM91733.1 hypothetical protein UP17_03405 [Peribacillus simplex]